METEAERVITADGIFTQYANLLSVEQQGVWEKIVEQKVGVSDWMDLCGCKHKKKRGKTYKHFFEFICRPSSMKTPWNVSRFI